MRCHYCARKPPVGAEWPYRLVEIVAGRIRERCCDECAEEHR